MRYNGAAKTLFCALTLTTLVWTLPALAGESPNFTRNGQAIFPIGTYDYPRDHRSWNEAPDLYAENIKEMISAGFNNILRDMQDITIAELDVADYYGMTVTVHASKFDDYNNDWAGNPIYHVNGSVFDNKIQLIKNKPALWMYDIWDEPGWNIKNGWVLPTYTSLCSARDFLHTKDPNHNIWYCEVSGQLLTFAEYRQWLNITDTYAQDWYPVGDSAQFPNADLASVGNNMAYMLQIADGDGISPYDPTKPLSFVVQGQGAGEWNFDVSDDQRRPNFIENRYMVYDAVINGAKGIWWWGCADILATDTFWKETKRIASELKYLSPMLLTANQSGCTLGNSNLKAIYKIYNGDKYLIVANRSSNTINNASIRVTNWNYARNGNKVRVLFEAIPSTGERRISTTSTRWYDNFAPWEVHIYTDKLFTNVPGDFDGDAKTDITHYIPETGEFQIKTSTSGFSSVRYYQTGLPNAMPVYGDWDGDGLADIGLYIPSTGYFHILTSSQQFSYAWWYSYNTGFTNITPVTGDFDGDGRSDIGVYLDYNGWWDVLTSSSNFSSWLSIDTGSRTYHTPVSNTDWDGDGKSDVCLYSQTGGWYDVKLSSTNFSTWLHVDMGGMTNRVPAPGDYDGDKKCDACLYSRTTGVFDVRTSSTSYTNWWTPLTTYTGHTPYTGDWEADGKSDLTTYAQGNGWNNIWLSSSNFASASSYPAVARAVPYGGYPIRFQGVVTESGTGTAVAGATVIAREINTGNTYTTTSDSAGYFVLDPIAGIPIGTYRLSVDSPSAYYDVAEGSNIEMRFGRVYIQNYSLQRI